MLVTQIRAFRSEINTVRKAAMDRNVKLSSMMRTEMEAIVNGQRDLDALKEEKEKMTSTTFMVDEELLEKYKEFATHRGISFEKAMRMALRSIILNTTNSDNN